MKRIRTITALALALSLSLTLVTITEAEASECAIFYLESLARDENPTEQNTSEIAPQRETAFRSCARQFGRMLRMCEQGESGSQLATSAVDAVVRGA